MNAHKNARLMPRSRAVLVHCVLENEQTPQMRSHAPAQKVSPVCDYRSSQPHKPRHPTPEYVIRRIEALQCPRWTGSRTATELGLSPSTISRTLHRLGLSKIKDIYLPPTIGTSTRATEPAR